MCEESPGSVIPVPPTFPRVARLINQSGSQRCCGGHCLLKKGTWSCQQQWWPYTACSESKLYYAIHTAAHRSHEFMSGLACLCGAQETLLGWAWAHRCARRAVHSRLTGQRIHYSEPSHIALWRSSSGYSSISLWINQWSPSTAPSWVLCVVSANHLTWGARDP